MARRRLTAIRLDKIAAVDAPCQEHATVAIVKRAPVAPEGPRAIAKVTFQEALEGNMIAGAVNEAFFDSFDGLWERNDAFRTALTDELGEGGDGSAASAAYVASVKTLVDDAVAAARDAGSTAADTSEVDKALNSAVEKWLAAKKEQTMTISTKAALGTAIAKFASAGVAATIGDRDAILKAAKDLNAEDMLPADGPLAKAAPDSETALIKRRLDIAEMPADVRKHFDALDEAAQTAFLAKSATERAEVVAKANEEDPVLYKCKDGTEIRKSQGALTAQLAKRADEQDEKIAKLTGDLTMTTIEKRAAAFPNVAKAVAVDMLKTVDQVGADTEAGKAVMKSLETMNKAARGLFKTLGTTEGDEGGPGEGDAAAVTEFNAEVGKVAREEKIGVAEAMTKVRNTNPDLFKRAYPQPEEEEIEA